MSKCRSTVARKSPSKNQPSLTGAAKPSQSQGDLLSRIWNLAAQLRESRDPDKVLTGALRMAMDAFQAAEGCAAAVRRRGHPCDISLAFPETSSWDANLLTGVLSGNKMAIPPDLMFSRIRRYGRPWGALVLRCPHAEFGWDLRHAFSFVGRTVTDLLERIDHLRLAEVRARIDRKILEQLAPKDLFYQILHGLRSLVGYDHSAALLICDEDGGELEIVAEQIAWQKAKSENIGLRLGVEAPVAKLLRTDTVYAFDRQGKGWSTRSGCEAGDLAELLDYNPWGTGEEPSTAENAILCAPLTTRRGLVGILKVAAVHQGTFGDFEAKVVSQFLAQAAIAVENLRRTEAIAVRMRAAERELDEARQFQVTMLPPRQAQFARVAVTADYLACNQLAGDFYDYGVANDGSIALLIADVVGHGASAAMMTGIVKAAFHASRQDGLDPLAVVDRLKFNLRAFDPGRFVTLTCARIDANGHTMTYVNAGHPPGMLRRRGAQPMPLEPTGPLLSSALSDYQFTSESLRLANHDTIFFYTDGLIEAWGTDEMFGKGRLLALLNQGPCPGPNLVDEVLGSVIRFSAGRPLADDITVLAVDIAHDRTP